MKHFFAFPNNPFVRFTRRGALLLALGAAGPAAWGQGFGPASTYPTTATITPQGVAVGDINGDGLPDIVAGSYGSGEVNVLLGQAGGFAAASGYSTTAGGTTVFPTRVALGDLNNDGRLDIVAGSYSNAIAILLGQSGGGFSPVAIYYATPNNGRGNVALGDMNNDARLDIVMVNNGTAGVLLGQATGGFAAVAGYAMGNNANIAFALGDVNADGRLDIVSVNSVGVAAVLLGQAGGFVQAGTYSTGAASRPVDVGLGDVNGDGRLDIVASSSSTSNVALLLGQAGGSFAPAIIYQTGVGAYPGDVALADVNGDNRLDLAVTDYPTNSVVVMLGQIGGFGPISRYATGTGTVPLGITLADVNRDGRPDVITGNYVARSVSVLLNTGTYTPLAARPTAPADVALAPNPAHDAFTVTLPAGTTATGAELLNALGQVVRRPAAAGSRFQVETAGLAPGVYSLRLQTGGTVLTKRVVVE